MRLEDDCDAEQASRECPSYTSSSNLQGKTQSRTWSLQSGTYCDIDVDANEFVGRLLFDDVSDLGIQRDGANVNVGTLLSFATGSTGSVRIYNAA